MLHGGGGRLGQAVVICCKWTHPVHPPWGVGRRTPDHCLQGHRCPWAYCRAMAQLLQVHWHALTADSCYSRLCRSNGREDSSRDRERDRDRDRARDRDRDRDIERERERERARRDDRHRGDRCRHKTLHFVPTRFAQRTLQFQGDVAHAHVPGAQLQSCDWAIHRLIPWAYNACA